MSHPIEQTLRQEYHIELGDKLGQPGGYGQVFLGYKGCERLEFAVKIGHDQHLSKKELRGVQNVKHIKHSHLLQLVDLWVIDGYLVTVWDLAKGGSLRDSLRSHCANGDGGIPEEKATRYIKQAAEGLEILHGRGIQHRDVKPDNLLLDEHDNVKVGDYGLAKFVGDSRADQTPGIGSFNYMPPEAFRGQLDNLDLYSLGVTYVELRTGRLPFARTDVERSSPNLEELGPAETEIVRKALAPNPDDRPTSAVQWAKELSESVVIDRSTGRAGDSGFAPLEQEAVSGHSNRLARLRAIACSRRRTLIFALLLVALTGVGIWAAYVGGLFSPSGGSLPPLERISLNADALTAGDILDEASQAVKSMEADSRGIVLPDIALAYISIGDNVSALAACEEWKSSLSSFDDGAFKAFALSALATIQSAAGDKQAARRTLTQAIEIVNAADFRSMNVNEAFKHIAAAQAHLGDFVDAEKMCWRIVDRSLRNETFATIATAYARQSQPEAAEETAQSINFLATREEALRTLASLEAHARLYDRAITIVKTLENEGTRDEAFADIVRIQLEHRRIEDAANSIQLIDDISLKNAALANLAKAQCDSGDLDAAEATCAELSVSISQIDAFVALANSQVSKDIARAESTLGHIRSALTELENTLSEAKPSREQLETLNDIAALHVGLGEDSAARVHLNSAIVLYRSLKSSGSVDESVLVFLTKRQAANGNIWCSWHLYREIETHTAQAEALAWIAYFSKKSGGESEMVVRRTFANAVAGAERLADIYEKGAAIQLLADLMARADLKAEALKLANKQTIPLLRVRACLGIANALMD